mmetsp:Transcript_20349/g.47105  ORF Transcript_20349/g.47105 Transcript_20349/m.47105 type:complete len:209 (+) Transcript_20349:1093-1719(+)
MLLRDNLAHRLVSGAQSLEVDALRHAFQDPRDHKKWMPQSSGFAVSDLCYQTNVPQKKTGAIWDTVWLKVQVVQRLSVTDDKCSLSMIKVVCQHSSTPATIIISDVFVLLEFSESEWACHEKTTPHRNPKNHLRTPIILHRLGHIHPLAYTPWAHTSHFLYGASRVGYRNALFHMSCRQTMRRLSWHAHRTKCEVCAGASCVQAKSVY